MAKQSKIHRRTSEIIADVIASAKGDGSISVGEILELLSEKSFCLAILVLAIPNCLPIPNVLAYSALTGIPIVILSMQMIIGRNSPWLPHFISSHRFSRSKFASLLTKIQPYIRKIDRVVYPRTFFISVNLTERLVGIAFFLLAIVLSLPIPFGNLLPGFAISLIAIGLIERDGVMMAGGLIFGIVSCLIMFATIKAIIVSLVSALF